MLAVAAVISKPPLAKSIALSLTETTSVAGSESGKVTILQELGL